MSDLDGVDLRWRGGVSDAELVVLTRSHGGRAVPGWWDQVRPHSSGWVTARLLNGALVGFVNVACDGGRHAFLLDTKTRPDCQHRGIGTAVVTFAVQHVAHSGCEWLHVDFGDDLRGFYFDACGFRRTEAGLINLWQTSVNSECTNRPGPSISLSDRTLAWSSEDLSTPNAASTIRPHRDKPEASHLSTG
jgi:GNAT superfamily N-acetyltransferase